MSLRLTFDSLHDQRRVRLLSLLFLIMKVIMLSHNSISRWRNENISNIMKPTAVIFVITKKKKWYNTITTIRWIIFYSQIAWLEYNAFQWMETICIFTFPFVGMWRYQEPISIEQSITMTCFWGHLKLLFHRIEFCFAYCLCSAVKDKLIHSVIGLACVWMCAHSWVWPTLSPFN